MNPDVMMIGEDQGDDIEAEVEVVAVDPVGLEVMENVVVGTVVAAMPEEAVALVHTMMMARTIINQLEPCVVGDRDGMSQSTEIILEISHLKRNKYYKEPMSKGQTQVPPVLVLVQDNTLKGKQ